MNHVPLKSPRPAESFTPLVPHPRLAARSERGQCKRSKHVQPALSFSLEILFAHTQKAIPLFAAVFSSLKPHYPDPCSPTHALLSVGYYVHFPLKHHTLLHATLTTNSAGSSVTFVPAPWRKIHNYCYFLLCSPTGCNWVLQEVEVTR